MREAFRGRGRGRGGGVFRNPQRGAVPDPPQQQWSVGPGLVPGLEARNFNPREPRARPDREAEPPHGPLAMHGQPPHRRRQQLQAPRRDRVAPYGHRHAMVAPVLPGMAVLGPPVSGDGGSGRGLEAVGGPLARPPPVPVCAVPTLCRSVYADQIIDYRTGKICPQRFKVAFREVSKLVRPPQGQPVSPVSGFPGVIGAGAVGGMVMVDRGPPEGLPPNGTVVQHRPLEADEMSEVSQVEEGEVDEEGPHGAHLSAPQPSVSGERSNQQEQQVAAASAARKDPRLAARARAEASGQQQQQHDTMSPVQQQKLQQASKFDCEKLPPSLRRGPLLSGKLPLLLDLDNTLLHAQAVSAAGYTVDLADWLDEDGLPEMYKFALPLNRKEYYLKLRPGLRRFLKALAPVYELSIYTNATQEYADLVIAILDPDRSLFGSRIVARESSARTEQSENKTVRCLYGDLDRRCVVAFDDRQNIWIDLPLPQVVKAQHYDFFDSSRPEMLVHYPQLLVEENNAASAENSRQRNTVFDRPSPVLPAAKAHLTRPYDWDRHLHYMVDVFLKIHQEFFKDPWNTDLGKFIGEFQKTALDGVYLFLTGFRKSGVPQPNAHNSLQADSEERQGELAERLGAKIRRRYDDKDVTHVMAGKNNTNNMLALKDVEFQHLKKVHTLWLFSCEGIWGKAPERCFDADTLCTLYENMPPNTPLKDQWMHLAQFSPPPVVSPAQPLPHPDHVPVRDFIGTGPYSKGATLTSPFEQLLFDWIPERQPIRQLYSRSSTQQTQAADALHQQQQLMAARPESQHGGERHDIAARSNMPDAEVMPFCNYQVYAQ